MEVDRERDRILRKEWEPACEGTILRMCHGLMVANSRGENWDFIHHDDAVAVMPVLPDGGVLTVRQYRNVLGHFTLELPAGKVDSPEGPRVLCAFRELSEETDMRAEGPEAFEFLLWTDTIVAFCNEGADIFVAQSLLPGKQHLDSDKVINMQTYELSGFLARVERSGIRDTKTVAGLTAYTLKQSRSNRV